MDVVEALTQRSVIIGLAIVGAILVMGSGLLNGAPETPQAKRSRLLSQTGYAVTFLSIALFIVAGFISGR